MGVTKTMTALLLTAATLPVAANENSIRFATYNASLNRNSAGALATELSAPGSSQASSIAEIIQKVNPDVILINEFDVDLSGQTAADFQANYLGVSQNGQAPVSYGYFYVADSNTGVLSGFDLNNDGTTATNANLGSFTYANDSQGFGQFPGQFGYVIYSKHAIDTANVRTFQNFLWKDMPGNLLTNDPSATPADNLGNFYSAAEQDALRLSSKNHVDLPILIGDDTVHILAAHPTPPVFDGSEDRNGKRNHDEIKFWADYINGQNYMTDDHGGTGGLGANDKFVVLGDYNADPFDGDSYNNAIDQLLGDPLIIGSSTDASITPDSLGGPEQAIAQGGANAGHSGDPAFDTADFGFNFNDPTNDNPPGNLRVDYALPSANMDYVDGGVFWPDSTDPDFALASFPTSDHRLVYVDVAVPEPASAALLLMGGALLMRRRKG